MLSTKGTSRPTSGLWLRTVSFPSCGQRSRLGSPARFRDGWKNSTGTLGPCLGTIAGLETITILSGNCSTGPKRLSRMTRFKFESQRPSCPLCRSSNLNCVAPFPRSFITREATATETPTRTRAGLRQLTDDKVVAIRNIHSMRSSRPLKLQPRLLVMDALQDTTIETINRSLRLYQTAVKISLRQREGGQTRAGRLQTQAAFLSELES